MRLDTALAARPRQLIQVATGEKKRGRESTTTVCYADATLIDRLHYHGQLSDKQHAAGVWLLQLQQMACLGMGATSRYGSSLAGHDNRDENPAAKTFYAALVALRGEQRMRVRAALMDEQPGWRGLPDLQAGLDAIAKLQGITEMSYDDVLTGGRRIK